MWRIYDVVLLSFAGLSVVAGVSSAARPLRGALGGRGRAAVEAGVWLAAAWLAGRAGVPWVALGVPAAGAWIGDPLSSPPAGAPWALGRLLAVVAAVGRVLPRRRAR